MRLKFSAMGKASQRVQAERRLAAVTPEYLAEIATTQLCCEGAVVGSVEIRNFLTGTVKRWALVQGHRKDRFAMRAPDGRKSTPHSATWIMDRLRKHLRS